jgi:tetratricopeptide (TPR) repeat protein
MHERGLWPAGLLFVALIPCLVPDRTEAAPGPSFEELRERGRKAYRAKRFEEARDLWADAYALRLDDAETAADLALAYRHTEQNDQAIEANRDAIRLSSAGKLGADKARRIRRAAYYNLGKLRAKRDLKIGYDENDGPSTCLRVASEPWCARPMFVCGRIGATGSHDGGFDYTLARFALNRDAARIVEDGQLDPELDSWVHFGTEEDATHDRSDAASYDVTLDYESEARKPMPGEADVVFARESSGCEVVHVDACARRLGLYCAWGSWEEGVTDKGHAKAVELTFARKR